MATKKIAIVSVLAGLVVGAGIIGAVGAAMMPGMMIVQHESPHGFDETVARIEGAIVEQGWVLSETINMNNSMAKHDIEFAPQVRVIKLCKPEYAEKVLTTDRYLSCLMPCAIAVWEADGGEVMISKMNTGLMGKLFGGNVAKIMGGAVSADETMILNKALAS